MKTNEDWVEDFKKTHGTLYRYPEPIINGTTKIKIECLTHGLFLMTPKAHRKGQRMYFMCKRKKHKVSIEKQC